MFPKLTPPKQRDFLFARPVNTNDAFVGIDSYDLKLRGSSKDFPPAFDAGENKNTC